MNKPRYIEITDDMPQMPAADFLKLSEHIGALSKVTANLIRNNAAVLFDEPSAVFRINETNSALATLRFTYSQLSRILADQSIPNNNHNEVV